MKPTSRVLTPVRKLVSAARVRSLFRMIDHPDATPEKVRRAVDSLISSIVKHDLTGEASTDAAEGLFRRWSRVPQTQRSRFLKIDGRRWKVALARVAGDESPEMRRVAASLAAGWAVAETIRAAGRLVSDSDDSVAGEAEVSLLTVCEFAGDLTAPALAALDETLARLARRFPEHRRKAVLRAVVALGPHAGPEVREWLATGADAELMPLRGVMKEPGAVSRVEALRLLAVPALASAAAERVAQPASAAEHEACLPLSVLLEARGRGGALRRLADPLAVLPGQADLERLGVESRIGAQRWVMRCPVSSSRRAVALGQMLGDPEAVVRCNAVRRLGQLAEGASAGGEALQDAVFDSDPAVALAALRELHRLAPGRAQEVAHRLLSSASAEVRDGAQRVLRVSDPWALVETNDAAGWCALRRRLADEPVRAISDLRARVGEGPAARRTVAVVAARRLGVVEEIENELLCAAAGDDERVASAAVLALGDCGTAASRAAVSSCLAHPDDRVRANAVEAIARRDPDEPVVRAWVENEVPRARANAVRARVVLAKDSRGAGALSKMLSDERRSHRLSGLWVAERAGMVGMSELVAEIARTEREPHVRERARRCARRLLAEMRWSEAEPHDLPAPTA